MSYHIAILQLMKDRSDDAQLLYREVTRRRLCPAWITGTVVSCRVAWVSALLCNLLICCEERSGVDLKKADEFREIGQT